MESGPHTHFATHPAALAAEPDRPVLRLSLIPGTSTGAVVGVWWPRSAELTVELPALLGVLAVRVGRVVQATFNPGAWNPTVRHLIVEGQAVQLAGFPDQAADIVTVVGTDRQRLSVLVVPSGSTPADAEQALRGAMRSGDADEALPFTPEAGVLDGFRPTH